MATDEAAIQAPLCWHTSDPEQRLLFRGQRFTRVNSACTLLLALCGTVIFYLALLPVQGSWIATTFMERGAVPYAIVFFSCWSLAMLGMKYFKLRLQRLAFNCPVVPDDPAFVLSPLTVDDVTTRIYEAADDPRQFVLFNRLLVALSNLKNLGRVTDVDEILLTQAEQDGSTMETSYLLLHGFVWAIPVLGFIGTVEGLSRTIGGLGKTLASSSDFSTMKSEMQEVTGGLSTAFETTMQGLVAALVIQLLLTSMKKAEEEFLESCSEYCTSRIVGRLRLLPFESTKES